MRVLRLDLGDRAVELHPFVSVVRGVAPALRESLLLALAGAAGGRAVVPGLVEVDGVRFDLTPSTLELFDLGGGADPVVRRDQLPGAGGSTLADPTAAAAAAEEELAAAERRAADARAARAATEDALLAVGRPGGAPEVARAAAERAVEHRAEARRAVDLADAAVTRARTELSAAEARTAEARRRRAEANRSASVAAAALETATARRDPIAVAAEAAARERLATAEAAVAATRHGDAGPELATDLAPEVDPEDLRARRAEVETGLLALAGPDPLPVRLALELAEAGAAAVELVPSPAALALADDWAAVRRDAVAAGLADDPADDAEGGDRRNAAVERLRAAEEALATAERASRGVLVGAEDIAALEAAHAAVERARQSARRGRGARAAALADAEQAEQDLLDGLGFVTYAEFQIEGGRAGRDDSPAAQAAVDAARAEVGAARHELAAVETGIAVELARAEVLDRRRDVRARAVALLGEDPGDGELEGALRRVRVPAEEPVELHQRLRAALAAAGVDLGGDEVPARIVRGLAALWLAEQDDVAERRQALERQLADVDARLARHDHGASGAGSGVDDPLAAAVAAAERARGELAAARTRLERHLVAEADVEAARAALAQAGRLEADAVAAARAAEHAEAEAAAGLQHALATLAAAERDLAAAVAAEEAAVARFADLTSRVEEARRRGVDDLAALVGSAADRAERLEAVVAAQRSALEALRAGRPAPAPGGDGVDVGPPPVAVADAEWYLLARLAALRGASLAGSVPLVLDDTLAAFGGAPLRYLLGRLERMAGAVQVVVLSEDLAVAHWAVGLGPARAAVVEPRPAGAPATA